MTDKDELAALKKKIEELEAKVSPPKSDFVPMSDAEWIDQMHQMRERRMALASNFHPDDLRAMNAACPTSTAQDLWRHGTVQSPSMAGASGQVTSSHPGRGAAVNTTGWVDPRPLGPPPGIRYVDAQLDAQDAKDRAELAQRLGALKR